MLSDDDSDPEPIMPDVIYETSGVTLGPRMLAPFRLVPEAASVQAATVEPLIFAALQCPDAFILIPDVAGVQAPYADDSQTLDIQALRLVFLSGAFSVLQYSSDALTRALSQIRVDTTTTPEGLIHMMTAGRRVPSVLLDNGSALNVCPLATAIALGYAPSDFGPSTQTVRAFLRIPTSFNLLLGRPWIHRAGAIPSSLHQKVKFIHDGRVVVVQSVGDMFISAEPVLEISHADDDLFLTGFTFDEVQTLEMEDFCRDFVALSFDQHSSTGGTRYYESMAYLPGMGLGGSARA
ncbi:hypothetical protein CK203_042827 [Vitis vinifera]|uniref:Uncharacterized protein n=1 Tax=Vitis vinifera TaxID=29760 RepID=A0A438HQL4_VITVI|nr:hypothetical protein CK203_042827 [Vitis vinifera]